MVPGLQLKTFIALFTNATKEETKGKNWIEKLCNDKKLHLNLIQLILFKGISLPTNDIVKHC